MNWLKKSFNYFLSKWYMFIIIILMIFLIIFVIIKSVENSSKVLFASVLENYSVSIYDDTEEFKVRLYTNKENTMYFKKDNIQKCYFKNKLSSGTVIDSFRVNLNSIEFDSLTRISDIPYYVYDLSFQIPFKESNALKYENFYLELDYLNEEEIEIYLGSLCLLTEYNNNHNLVISSLKGETIYKDGKESLSKVLLTIKDNKDIVVNNIELLSGILTDDDYNIIFDKGTYIININKVSDIPISRVGIVISYTINDIEYSEVIEPFTFFTNNTIPNLEKYYYE